ncbi:MAG: FtsX-like permease family protein [bacterium]|nr:FtsX-like permease family protein [bacterium]
MFGNYLKLAFRNMMKQKTLSFINISGLSIGMTCCILIFLYVGSELSYDSYHKDSDRLYRITTDGEFSGTFRKFAVVPGPLGAFLKERFPEVKDYARIVDLQIIQQGQSLIEYDENQFEERKIFFVDSSFFRIFTHEFVSGDPKTALSRPNVAVITEEMAEKLFAGSDPVGKTIKYSQTGDVELEITGVINNTPANSHFDFNILVSISSLPPVLRANIIDPWVRISVYNYLLIDKFVDVDDLESRFNEVFLNEAGGTMSRYGISLEWRLQNIKDIHLHSDLEFELQPNGDIRFIYIFSAIALFILVIACINFMNLSTAKSSNRAKEVGLRKVFGAYRINLVTQFLSESVIITVISLIIAFGLAMISLPEFSNISGKQLDMELIFNGYVLFGISLMIIFTGILAGSYPAFFLSNFRPAAVFRGHLTSSSGGVLFRKIMVVLQFSISVTLIIGTLIVMGQLDYMKNKPLGFDKEQIIVVNINDSDALERSQTVKNELKQNPDILEVTYSSSIPGRVHIAPMFRPEGFGLNESQLMDAIFTDFDFIKTYGLKILYGRDLSINFPSDSSKAYIINEAAVKKLGWECEDAVGKEFAIRGGGLSRKGRIVGIVKDFHSKSVKLRIDPVVLAPVSFSRKLISIRIDTEDIPGTLQFILDRLKNMEPGREPDYFFLDEDFDKNYMAETRLSAIFRYFAILAVIIACLGLFGLASFSAQNRIKEIGIRKSLGASAGSIIVRLSGHFIKWVVIANILAWPLAYYLINYYWLVNFPYRINPGIFTFIISGILSVVIAVATVAYQSFRAAAENPVKALRHE